MKADLFFRRGRASNEVFNGGKDLRELLVVFLLKGFDFASEMAIRVHEPAQLYERAHDGNVYLNRARGAQDAREHGNALLGKGIRQCAAKAAPT